LHEDESRTGLDSNDRVLHEDKSRTGLDSKDRVLHEDKSRTLTPNSNYTPNHPHVTIRKSHFSNDLSLYI
jgi:hypothetical protein